MKKAKVKVLRGEEWQIEGDLVLKEEKMYVLKDKCCDNHLSQGQIITQGVNLLVEVSSGEFTRELDKEPLLN